MTKAYFEPIFILGVRVDQVNLDELLQFVVSIVEGKEKAVIANVNVYAVNLAQKFPWFRKFINSSRVVFCDGFGVKWAARLLKDKVLARFTPPDWFDFLANKCAQEGFTMFLMGTRQPVIERAALVLQEKHPQLKLVGIQHGFFDKTMGSVENQAVVDRINALKPDILVVGFGMPTQEKWILDNWDQLRVHVVIPVGAFFDYLAGDVARAPRWMTDYGFEWLGRLLIEPQRLWKRYLVGNPLFIFRVILQKLKIRNYDT